MVILHGRSPSPRPSVTSPCASQSRARSTFGPLGASRTVSSWSWVIVAQGAARIRIGQRLLDPLREALGLDRQWVHALGEPLRGWLVDTVEREDDREHALRRVDHPLHARERAVGPHDGQQAFGRPTAPPLGGLLDPLCDELVWIVGESLLPVREQATRSQRDAVGDRLRRATAREQLLRELPRPPDRLDRLAVEIAEDAARRRRRIAPAVPFLETDAARELECLLERELLFGDARASRCPRRRPRRRARRCP